LRAAYYRQGIDHASESNPIPAYQTSISRVNENIIVQIEQLQGKEMEKFVQEPEGEHSDKLVMKILASMCRYLG
jgi:hypothetical protein